MPKISYFKDAFSKIPESDIEFDEYLNGIKEGRWENQILDYSTNKIKKTGLPCVSPSGLFNQRNTKGISKHSNFINIDVDAKDNPDLNLLEMRDEIYADDFIYAGHISVSGNGLSLYIKIEGAKHEDAYYAIEKYFANKFHIITDNKARDIPRLRFVSIDKKLHLYKNSISFVDYLPKQKRAPKNYADFITSASDFDFVIGQINKNNVNIAEDYHDWLTIGFAISSEFGEEGRNYFHIVSEKSSKYDKNKCDNKYNSLLKSKGGAITISSFFWLAKQAGLNIKTTRTNRIESVVRLRMKSVGKSGGAGSKEIACESAKKYLKEIEGIEGNDVYSIIEKVSELNDYELNAKKSDTSSKMDECVQILNSNHVKYNIITGKLEANNKPLTDIDVNSLYADILDIDASVSRQLFDTIIFSNRIKQFDPFLDFINKHSHLKPKGCIDALINTIEYDMRFENNRIIGYKELFIRKWLLSIIASAFGTYSLMILVLTGKQMTNKTNWFRNLLPPDLKAYYAESKLDAGKDDEIIMTQKLIIMDDEFGGKSKQEAKKLKDLSSKQCFTIRRPYGRFNDDIQRIAVLCGTSNDIDIINDPSGNRRIIPINIESINMDAYHQINKTELFIELYHEWFENKNGWMLTPEEVVILNQSTQEHVEDSSEEQLINKHFSVSDNFNSRMTTTDIKNYLETHSIQKLSLKKVGQMLTKNGFKRKNIKINGNTAWFWNLRETDPAQIYP